MWKKLYGTYVRPHLEYAIPVWNPYSTGDIMILEKIQHRATKIAHSMKGLSYNKRLEILNLTTLKTRRTRGDLIQKFKDISKNRRNKLGSQTGRITSSRGAQKLFLRKGINQKLRPKV